MILVMAAIYQLLVMFHTQLSSQSPGPKQRVFQFFPVQQMLHFIGQEIKEPLQGHAS